MTSPPSHYAPLPSNASDTPSASRWFIASTATSPPPAATSLARASTPQARSLLPPLHTGSSEGDARAERRAGGSAADAREEDEGDEFRYDELKRAAEQRQGIEGGAGQGKGSPSTSTRSVASSSVAIETGLTTSSVSAMPARKPVYSKWAPPAYRPSPSTATRPPSTLAPYPSATGSVTPTDSEPHRSPTITRTEAGGPAARRLLEKVNALQARRVAGAAAGPRMDEEKEGERDGEEESEAPPPARPGTPAALPPPTAPLEDSPAAPSTSSLFSAPPSPTAMRRSDAHESGDDLRAAQQRIDQLERALVAREADLAAGHARTVALEVREAALELEARKLRADLNAREADARAGREGAARAREQLADCVALLVAGKGLVDVLGRQEEVGREALLLAEDAIDLGEEIKRVADDAASCVSELVGELRDAREVQERWKAELLRMRRKEADLDARVRVQEDELVELRARSAQHVALLHRVNFYLAQIDGDLFVEPVGDGDNEITDPVNRLEAALARLAQVDERSSSWRAPAAATSTPDSDAVTPGSLSTSAIADELVSLCLATEALQGELADARATSERRIKLLVDKSDEVRAAKDGEISELRQRLAEARPPAGPPSVYTPYELLHLSQSPLVSSTRVLEGSLPLQIDVRQPVGRLDDPPGAMAHLVTLTAQHSLAKYRVAFLEGELDSCGREKLALEAHNAELERVNAEAYEVMGELARELERREGRRVGEVEG